MKKKHSKEQKKNLTHVINKISSDNFDIALTDYNYGHRQNWHKHDEFILTMNLKGLVREQVKSEDLLLKPFSVGIKPAGVLHTDHFSPKSVRAIRISLSENFINELENQALLDMNWRWTKDLQITRQFLRLVDGLVFDKLAEEDCSAYIYEIFAALLPHKNKYNYSDAPVWLKTAKENLEENFTAGVRLTQLADEANVHPVYFARQFRRFYGCSVGRYVRRIQFQKSADLLADSNNSLAGIAIRLGFSDQSHLTRIFASEFGITPGHFRKFIN